MTLADTIARYARRFSVVHRVGHSVSSPMGAWLVLATAAQAASGDAREVMAEILGIDVDAAATALDDLLLDPPEVVGAAVAAWGLDATDWARRLSSAIETGPVPTKPALDEWATEHTLGLIPEFPLASTAGIDVLLASALATRAPWYDPFDVTEAARLQSPWSAGLAEVLVDEDGHGRFVESADAGLVGVHIAFAHPDLIVVSVIAEPDVDRTAVLAAAHDIAVAGARQTLTSVPLSQLALGEHGFFSVEEATRPGGSDACTTVMPAWEVASDVDLTDYPQLGFAAAAGGLPFDAKQVAVARYGRDGFEAAAVTLLALGGAPSFEPALARVAELRFGHPYAVVAATVGRSEADPWAGMPVFAAWVETPSEVSAVTTGP